MQPSNRPSLNLSFGGFQKTRVKIMTILLQNMRTLVVTSEGALDVIKRVTLMFSYIRLVIAERLGTCCINKATSFIYFYILRGS